MEEYFKFAVKVVVVIAIAKRLPVIKDYI